MRAYAMRWRPSRMWAVRRWNPLSRFDGLSDFANRIDPRMINKRQLENLAKAGAFDTLNGNRAQVLAGVEHLLRHASAAADSRTTGQESLFGGAGGDVPDVRLPEVEEWLLMEQLAHERDACRRIRSRRSSPPSKGSTCGNMPILSRC